MNKDKQLKIRIHLKDLVRLKELAKAEGKTVTDFVLEKSLSGTVPPTTKFNPDIGF